MGRSGRARGVGALLNGGALAGLAALGLGALGLAVLVGAAALVWWEGAQREGSLIAHWSVPLVTFLAVALFGPLGIGLRRRWPARRREVPSGGLARGLSLAAWLGLLLFLVGWDIGSLLGASGQLPTLSHLAGQVSRHRWGRSLLFALWLVAGIWVLCWPVGIGAVRARRGSRGTGAARDGRRGRPVTGLVLGEGVWAGYAALLLAWTLASVLGRRHLWGLAEVLALVVARPLCRLVLLAGWVELGWHLFCERP